MRRLCNQHLGAALLMAASVAGAVVLYLGTVEKQIEGIEILPWQAGLERMGL